MSKVEQIRQGLTGLVDENKLFIGEDTSNNMDVLQMTYFKKRRTVAHDIYQFHLVSAKAALRELKQVLKMG